MLSREAVRKLTELVDVAADTEEGWIDIKEIKKTWEIKGFYAYAVRITKVITNLNKCFWVCLLLA
jgi:hypothetical protein